jgi:asparagine synthetase B (glutamine-hydrolysing)
LFSGGRDSSAVLALATELARRHGLPDPIPGTHRLKGAPDTAESEWQDLVIAHLRLADWDLRHSEADLDLVGPVAERVLRRWGPVFPGNAHFFLPFFEAAAGGSLLSGVGGDELFALDGGRSAAQLLTGHVRPRPRDWRPLAEAASPQALRRAVYRRRITVPAWLRPGAARALTEQLATDAVLPLWHGRRIRDWLWPRRYLWAARSTYDAFAAATAVHRADPLLDAGFLRNMAAAYPRTGFRSRTEGMHVLFGDVLPPAVVARRTKAVFNEAFFHDHTRDFARRWDGTGLDDELVDPEALRATWLAPPAQADARSCLALQAAWCAEQSRVSSPAA